MRDEAWSPVGGLDVRLLEIGVGGSHPLFDAADIRRTFCARGAIRQDAVLAAHCALRALGRLRHVGEMNRYVASLPTQTLEVLIFLYFRCLDRFMQDQGTVLH